MSLFVNHADSSSTPTKRSPGVQPRILLSNAASCNSPPQKDAEDNCLKSDNGESKPEINTVENTNTTLEDVIEQHDIGLLNFDTNAGKAIVPEYWRIEIVKLGWKYFQNCKGPFLPTNNRSMNKNWFKRKLGNGRDPVMKEHLCYVESHPGSTSYLSPDVQNEYIYLMASAVRQNLLKGIRRAKYYGLMFDTTPDRAHHEQISQVVRYVEVDFERKCVRVRESFLGFIQAGEKDAESLVDVILKQLADNEMALED
ncbi:uncharacterized protein LOC115212143 [Octopus sinensis]|uniref:Uncharacterized protein LOC115212143 n=1 Tax=Octopus sinensis TaxID=2607531 RepID=A0A6P7SFW2_9MOLL|nr:uncharacterized protein LOC115212143 [Octopus sinensis]